MSKLYLLFGLVGVTVAGTGTGLGIYYGTRGEATNQKTEKPKAPDDSGPNQADQESSDLAPSSVPAVSPKEPSIFASHESPPAP